MEEGCAVYVLESLVDDFRYRGLSTQPEQRVLEHDRGAVSSTKPHRPFRIVYLRWFETRAEAREHEKYLKTSAGRRFLRSLLRQKGKK